MASFWIVAVPLVVVQGPRADVKFEFRGPSLAEPTFARFGPDAARLVKEEPDGVRITLASADQPLPSTGFNCKVPVRGDFEITVGYELLRADPPKGGYGAGAVLNLVADTPARETVSVARRVSPKGDEVYGSDLGSYTPAGEYQHVGRRHPAGARRGKLRASRVGAEVVLAAMADGESAFQELRRGPFTDAPLKVVRVVADPGQGLGTLDVRVTDLHIRAGSPAAVPPAGDAADLAADGGRGRWLTPAVLGLAALLAFAGLAAWLVWRRAAAGSR